MAKIRMIVIEGDLSVEDVHRLAKGFSEGDSAFTSITMPSGVVAQAATLSRSDEQPRPRPVAVPVVSESKPITVPVVEAPAKAEVTATPPPTPAGPPDLPPAIAKVFPEAVVEQEQPAAASVLDDLLACKRLSALLTRLQQEGHNDLPALIEACKTYRDSVPLLQRLGEGLEDRITRTFEGMQ